MTCSCLSVSLGAAPSSSSMKPPPAINPDCTDTVPWDAFQPTPLPEVVDLATPEKATRVKHESFDNEPPVAQPGSTMTAEAVQPSESMPAEAIQPSESMPAEAVQPSESLPAEAVQPSEAQ